MTYFKDTQNNLHHLDDAQFIYLLPEGSLEITDEEAEAIRVSQLPVIDPQIAIKAIKLQALATITVTTSSGKVFDGNETARINMLSAIQSATFLNQTQAGWKLADNTVDIVTVDEIKEALALAIQRVGDIVTS